MALSKERKQQIIKEFAIKEGDTGSADVQIAILTAEINDLNAHLAKHPHDYSSKRGLLIKVGTRRSLSKYLKNDNPERYAALIAKLGLRR